MVVEFCAVGGSSRIDIHKCLRSVCGEDATGITQLDTGSVIFRAVRRTLVTGLAAAS